MTERLKSIEKPKPVNVLEKNQEMRHGRIEGRVAYLFPLGFYTGVAGFFTAVGGALADSVASMDAGIIAMSAGLVMFSIPITREIMRRKKTAK